MRIRHTSEARGSYLAASIALASLLLAATVHAQDNTTAAPPAPSAQATDEDGAHPLGRWLDAQTFTVSARYNYIEDALDRALQNRVQTQAKIAGAFKFDAAGRYTAHAGLATGDEFRSGWNPTGVGTGDGTAKIYLRQLFVVAKPWNGIELEYGSLDLERGQSTEITTYDDDGYVTAGRINVRRPREVFFDDITVSVGYLGYLDTAFVFDRTGAFSRHNYWQVLASKRLLDNLELSTDYSELEDDGVLRQGVTWRVDRPFVDTVKAEYGVRLRGGSHQTAFALSGEKQVAAVTAGVGYANVDPIFGHLNGDPYDAGDRVFTDGSVALPLDLTATWFVQKEISPPVTSSNDLRIDLALRWDVLSTLKRAGAMPGKPAR
jgi:hypothetical protein